jgi:methionine synthase II (cobalamin-independent)
MAKPAPITIPTEPIGSIPRPRDLIARVAKGDSEDSTLAPLYEDAIRDTIERVEVTGSPVVTDGKPRKYHNFCTYCVHGLPNAARTVQNPVLRRIYAPDRWRNERKISLDNHSRRVA